MYHTERKSRSFPGKRSYFIFWLLSFILASSLFSFANTQRLSSSASAYLLCVNNKTKSVTYNKSISTCPKGFLGLTVSSPIDLADLEIKTSESIQSAIDSRAVADQAILIARTANSSADTALLALKSISADLEQSKANISTIESKIGSTSKSENYIFAILKEYLPKIMDATFTVECNGNIVTGTAIDVTLDQSLTRLGYRSAVITTASSMRSCFEDNVELRQDGNGWNGLVADIDEKNNIALVVLKVSNIGKLEPAGNEPIPGELLFSYYRGRGFEAGAVGVGVLNSLNPDFDEEIHNISVGVAGGGLTFDFSAPVINSYGEFISIASRKPGVLCRSILTCPTNSIYRAWSD